MTALTRAVALVEEFRDDWLANEETVLELAEKWGVGTSVIKTIAVRLELPARSRGPKVNRELKVSPVELRGGAWLPDARGILRWRRV